MPSTDHACVHYVYYHRNQRDYKEQNVKDCLQRGVTHGHRSRGVHRGQGPPVLQKLMV